MSVPFNPAQGLILVEAEMVGPAQTVRLRLALDTGASGTVINAGLLVAAGYDPALAPTRVRVTTASGVGVAPRLPVTAFRALGQERTSFPITALTLPTSTTVDGLLGSDFLRGYELIINFRTGQITLS